MPAPEDASYDVEDGADANEDYEEADQNQLGDFHNGRRILGLQWNHLNLD